MGKIYLIAQNNSDFESEDYNRYTYIFNGLKNKYQTIFVTSSFSHFTKKDKVKYPDENIVYIKETGYQKNVSIKRILSHFFFSYRVYKYLKKTVTEDDIIFCAIPSNSLAYFSAKIKAKRGNRLIIDIHDTWPESFIPLLPSRVKNNFLVKFLFSKWANLRNKGIKKCDLLVGESYEYVKNYEHFLSKDAESFPVLLGVNYDTIKNITKKDIQSDHKLKFCFAGNMGVNYDLSTIVNTLKRYEKELSPFIDFYFIGNGELAPYIEEETKDLNYVKRIKKTSYDEYISILKNMDVGTNSFTKDSNVKLSYKQSDYMACGLLLLNNISGRISSELSQLGLSVDYEANNIESLYQGIQKSIDLIKNNKFDKQKMISYTEENFDRKKCYEQLFQYIGQMTNENWRNDKIIKEN